MGRGLKLAGIGFLLAGGLFGAFSPRLPPMPNPFPILNREYDLRVFRGDDDFRRRPRAFHPRRLRTCPALLSARG